MRTLHHLQCLFCGSAFASRNKGQKYCSCPCKGSGTSRAKGQRTPTEMWCQQCGIRYMPRNHNAGRFCSLRCWHVEKDDHFKKKEAIPPEVIMSVSEWCVDVDGTFVRTVKGHAI